MEKQKIFDSILANIDSIGQATGSGQIALEDFIKLHPADIAEFLSELERNNTQKIFLVLPQKIKLSVFSYLSHSLQVYCLSFLPDKERSFLLGNLPIDELTDIFDELSDEELKKYLNLLHKKDRAKVLSLLQFDPESAGGIMHTNVLTLMQDFTIEKSIQILQRLQPSRELHGQIYVTNQENELLGHISLEDLVLKSPKTRLSEILKPNDLVINVNADRAEIAQQMTHYKVMSAPVISENDIFLGVITGDNLVDIIEQEAAEDVYKISALKPIKNTYFETPFFSLFYQRGSILIFLLLIQTFSTIIIQRYEALLAGFLISFISMIASTGGNSSSQTSALVIQGMLSGEITDVNMGRFLKREFLMAAGIGISLGLVSFIRIYLTHPGILIANFAVSLSLGIIVIVSVMLGSLIPLILKKLNMDPALSAGPFLATIMDVLGILIYCFISQLILN